MRNDYRTTDVRPGHDFPGLCRDMERIAKKVYQRLWASTNTPTIGIQLDEGAKMPVRAHATDAGADLFTPIDFTLFGHSSFSVNTGVHIELPHGYYARIASKSGLNVKFDIISEGVVDEGYSGPIVVRLHNLSKNPHTFAKGDKISQLIIEPVAYASFRQVGRVAGGERGEGGFGSTGTR